MSEMKKLNFPHRYSLGSVYIASSQTPESWELLQVPQGLVTRAENQPINWDWLDEARGNLAIPEGAKVKLKINNSAITKLSCLESLAKDSIHTLDLSRTGVTDQFLPHITPLTELQVLELAYTAISDEGIATLTKLKNLHTLGLTHAGITNTGLKEIVKLKSLRELWLNGTLIDDEGMELLKKLKKLVLLGLSGTRVTAEGLEALYDLSGLLRLYMFNTEIDENSATDFRSHVPQCRVKWRRAAAPRPEFMFADDADLSLDDEFDADMDLSFLADELDANGKKDTKKTGSKSAAKGSSKSAPCLNEEKFWELIDLFDWDEEGNDANVIEPCVEALSKLSEQEIFGFQEALYEKLYKLDSEQYARHIGRESYRGKNEYFSQSWFLNVRCCAIANGRELFEEVLNDPSEMPKGLGFRALCRVAEDAYQRKTGHKMSYCPQKSCETFSNKDGWPDQKAGK